MSLWKWFCRILPLLAFPLLPAGSSADFRGQQPPAGQPNPQTTATVRVSVGLVQTDVMVFDRQGRFVPDLKLEQFDLRVDGKRQPIAFCEQVSSGSGRDETLWTSNPPAAETPAPAVAGSSDVGRTVLLFLDDWHLSADSLMRSRAALLNLIDNAVGVSDRAGIFAASGSPGFLQQISDNKAVLRAAAEKLNFFNHPIQDKEDPVMSESQALQIEQNNQDVINYFIDAYLRKSFGRVSLGRTAFEKIVRRRASILASQSVAIAERTLDALGRVLRIFSALPGRKVLFFLSDGFILQTQRPEILGRIRQVTDAAARAGIVIHSLDSRGLIVGGPDAANPAVPDRSNRLLRNAVSEVTSVQDVLNALAVDTGGTFLKNTNALDAAMTRTLAETSRYYLLGWYLDRDMQEPGKYRSVRAGIKGRSDLKVRVRQGKVDLTLLAAQGRDGKVIATPARTDPAEALTQTIRSPFPIGALPVSLFTGYDLLRDKGFGLCIGLQTAIEQVESEAGKAADDPRIDFVGLVSDATGETVASFSDSLSMPTDPALQREGGDKEWNYSGVILLEPGIYQVRVAVRDSRTGRTGSSLQWVNIPQFSPDKITLSSIFMQENGAGQTLEPNAVPDLMNGSVISIKRRFSGSSKVHYFLRVLNPRLASIVVQTRIYRGNRVVHQSVPGPPEVQGSEDVSRMLVRGALPLEDLAPGDYTLEILVGEPSSNPAAVQRINFWVR
jgi:VWFA-related protein